MKANNGVIELEMASYNTLTQDYEKIMFIKI